MAAFLLWEEMDYRKTNIHGNGMHKKMGLSVNADFSP